MIFLKQLFNGKMAACLALLIFIMQVESTKIAYKKPIQGKTNANKEKYIKAKISEESKSTVKPTAVTPLAPTTTTTTTPLLTATTIPDELDVAETTHAIKTALSKEEKSKDVAENEQHDEESVADQNAVATNNSLEFQEVALPIENFEENRLEQQQSSEKLKNVPLAPVDSQERSVVEEPLKFEEVTTIYANQETTTPTATTTSLATAAATVASTTATTTTTSTTSTAAPTTPSNRPVPCTCGVFMTSQIKRTGNPYEAPVGRPVIINELDRTFPCNAIGQKQCQTKCLETIVQHLPNSANILCASLDRDIRKERAYLFIKNCRSQWFNTNLAAGREYCCKNGQPYQCPLV